MEPEIKIGNMVLPAAQCGRCPSVAKFYPAEILTPHFARYHPGAVVKLARGRQGGRPAGSKNRSSMSSTGIECKTGGIARPR